MSIQNITFRTISCNNTKCGKTITYDMAQEKQAFDNPENVWLKGVRQVTTLDQRMLAYCSDLCELAGIETGVHNIPEPKKIIETGGASAAQVQAAAEAAKRAEAATAALKSGGPVTLG
jgi:hypothetical protein